MLIKSELSKISVDGQVLESSEDHGFILMEFEVNPDGIKSTVKNEASLKMMAVAMVNLNRTIDKCIAEQIPASFAQGAKKELMASIEPDGEPDPDLIAPDKMDLERLLKSLGLIG